MLFDWLIIFKEYKRESHDRHDEKSRTRNRLMERGQTQLEKYVKKCRKNHFSDERIKEVLEGAGWDKDTIDHVLRR